MVCLSIWIYQMFLSWGNWGYGIWRGGPQQWNDIFIISHIKGANCNMTYNSWCKHYHLAKVVPVRILYCSVTLVLIFSYNRLEEVGATHTYEVRNDAPSHGGQSIYVYYYEFFILGDFSSLPYLFIQSFIYNSYGLMDIYFILCVRMQYYLFIL